MIPMYALDSLGVITSHLYTMFEARQFDSSGQEFGLIQLQELYAGCGLEALIFLTLDVEMFCARLGVVEYESLIVFLLNSLRTLLH